MVHAVISRRAGKLSSSPCIISSIVAVSMLLGAMPFAQAQGTTAPGLPARGTASPHATSASLPPNVQVSFLGNQPGGEPTIGVNAYGTLVADWEEQEVVDHPVGPAGFAVSNDSGTTFGTQHIIQVPGASWGYDVSTASTSPNGTMWVGYGACLSACNTGSPSTQDYVTAIWNNGSKWSQPINTMPQSQTSSFVDRDWIASTPNGTVYQIVDDASTNPPTNVYMGTSYDGTHFKPVQVIYGGNQLPIDAFAYNNTLWGAADLNASNRCTILLSGNGGTTWSPATGSVTGCDNTGGSISWQVVWGMDHSLDLTYIDSSGVWFTRSTDLGTSWSTAVKVSGAPPVGTAFETPTISASLTNGEISVIWLDTRSNTGMSYWYVYERDSYDNGTAWSPAVRQLSDLMAGSSSGFWPGDFIGSTLTPWGTAAGVWGEDDSGGVLQTYFGQLPLLDPASGNVTVTVVNSTGSPLKGTLVQVPGSGPSRTNASGRVTYFDLTPGSYTVSASETGYAPGSASAVVTQGTTKVITITLTGIAGRPAITSFTALPDPTVVGGTAYFNVSVTGGFTPYSFTYVGLPPGCTTQDTAALSCSPTSPGNYTVNASVTDSMGSGAYAFSTLHVEGLVGVLAIHSFTASPSVIPLGGTTYLNVSVSGGTAPFTYAYSTLPAGCTNADVPSLSCAPTSSGTYNGLTVTVTDSKSDTATSSSISFTVSPGATGNPTVSAFTASPSTIPLGGTTYLNVTATGGTSPYSYQFTGLPLGCTSSNTASLACAPTYAGPYNPTVTVTDSNGKTATSSAATFRVSSPAGYPVINSFQASPSTMALGETTTLSTQVSGGTTPYVYTYSNLPSGCATSNAPSFPCTPTLAGNFTITVLVRDANGNATSTTAPLTVTSPVSNGLTVSLSASKNPINTGETTTLTVTVSGGNGPYTYTYSNLPPGCVSSNTSTRACTPSANGTYTVKVSVTDIRGHSGLSSLVLTVKNPGPSGSGEQLGSWELWGLTIVVAAAVVGILVILLGRRRGGNVPQPGGPMTEQPAGSPESMAPSTPTPDWEEEPAGNPQDIPPPSGPGAQWPPPAQ